MTPVKFPEANKYFGPPPDLTETQCGGVWIYAGQVESGSVDGAPVMVTAWQPSPEELEVLNEGKPIFISFLCSGLPPHMLSTNFQAAVHPR